MKNNENENENKKSLKKSIVKKVVSIALSVASIGYLAYTFLPQFVDDVLPYLNNPSSGYTEQVETQTPPYVQTKTPLSAPSNFVYSNEYQTISWDKVSSAQDYSVKYSNRVYTEQENKFAIPEKLKDGDDITISVKANARSHDNNYTSSEYSDFTFEYKETEVGGALYLKEFLLKHGTSSAYLDGDILNYTYRPNYSDYGIVMIKNKTMLSFRSFAYKDNEKIFDENAKHSFSRDYYYYELYKSSKPLASFDMLLKRKDLPKSIVDLQNEGYTISQDKCIATKVQKDGNFIITGTAKLERGGEVKYATFTYLCEKVTPDRSFSDIEYILYGLQSAESVSVQELGFTVLEDEIMLNTAISTWAQYGYAVCGSEQDVSLDK